MKSLSKRMHLVVVGLIAVLFVAGCSQKKVVRVPAPLTTFVSPIDIQNQWQLQFDNFSFSDVEGLGLISDKGKLFMASPDGSVSRISATANGSWQSQVEWQRKFDEAFLSGVNLSREGLVLGSSKANVYLLSKSNGAIIWQTQLSSEVLSYPVIEQGLVFVRTVDGKMSVLSEKTGNVRWSVEQTLPKLSLRGIGSVAIEDGVVFVGWENGKLSAYRLKDGQTLWESQVVVPRGRTDLERLVDIQAKTLVHKGVVYVLAYNGKLVAINPSNGNLFWSKDVSGFKNILAQENRLVVIDDDSIVKAYDRMSGTLVWQNREFKYRKLTDMVATKQGIMMGDGYGYLHWVDPVNGSLIGRAQHSPYGTNGNEIVRVQLLENKVYVWDNDGYLTQYKVIDSDIHLFKSALESS